MIAATPVAAVAGDVSRGEGGEGSHGEESASTGRSRLARKVGQSAARVEPSVTRHRQEQVAGRDGGADGQRQRGARRRDAQPDLAQRLDDGEPQRRPERPA